MLRTDWKSRGRVLFALIIALTRKLVLQIHEHVRKFCDRYQYGCIKLYERISSGYIQREHDSRCDILVTTPGRLNEFLFKGYVHPKKLRYVVLDEVDRLKKHNFANDIINILESPSCVHINVKAKFTNFFNILTRGITIFPVNGPKKISNIIHTFICVDGVNKNRMCGDIIDAENEMANSFVLPSRKTLILVGEKRTSDILANFFIEKGIKA
uniref:Helicase ATP-binding domain-containing protein n=1 Tax=Strongyloides venezuelensis TaxID=75913 RepID=A0A0K0FRH1_STRVS